MCAGYRPRMGETAGRPFNATQRLVRGVRVIALAGELDYASVAAVQQRFESLFDAGENAAVVDLSAVTLITSSVINVLFAAVRRLRLAGGGLAVVCADPRIVKVLELTSFDRAAAICASEDDALRVLSQAAGGAPDAQAARLDEQVPAGDACA